MSVRQVQVTFDCAEPERVARFWCEVLGYVVPPPPPGFDSWDAFDKALPPLFFQRVPEGKTAKNRVHLDVRVAPGLVGDDRMQALEAEAARLEAAGATRAYRVDPRPPMEQGFITMHDPEGNEFCLD